MSGRLKSIRLISIENHAAMPGGAGMMRIFGFYCRMSCERFEVFKREDPDFCKSSVIGKGTSLMTDNSKTLIEMG